MGLEWEFRKYNKSTGQVTLKVKGKKGLFIKDYVKSILESLVHKKFVSNLKQATCELDIESNLPNILKSKTSKEITKADMETFAINFHTAMYGIDKSIKRMSQNDPKFSKNFTQEKNKEVAKALMNELESSGYTIGNYPNNGNFSEKNHPLHKIAKNISSNLTRKGYRALVDRKATEAEDLSKTAFSSEDKIHYLKQIISNNEKSISYSEDIISDNIKKAKEEYQCSKDKAKVNKYLAKIKEAQNAKIEANFASWCASVELKEIKNNNVSKKQKKAKK